MNALKRVILTFALLAAAISVFPAAAYADTETEDANTIRISVPVLMYHSVLKNGQSTYIVTPDQLEGDLQALAARGYHTVLPVDLVNYVENGTELPEKPIMITFDDGHYNNLFYALPLLQQYGCRAVFNVVGAFSEFSSTCGDHSKPSYSHATWEQIREAAAGGTFEIGNHTYNMHKYKPRYGIGRVYNESDEQYAAALRGDIMRLQTVLTEKCGVTPICFAYPFGKYTETSERTILSLGFKVVFTCCEGANILSRGDADCLQHMKRYNRDSKASRETLLKRIDQDTLKKLTGPPA